MKKCSHHILRNILVASVILICLLYLFPRQWKFDLTMTEAETNTITEVSVHLWKYRKFFSTTEYSGTITVEDKAFSIYSPSGKGSFNGFKNELAAACKGSRSSSNIRAVNPDTDMYASLTFYPLEDKTEAQLLLMYDGRGTDGSECRYIACIPSSQISYGKIRFFTAEYW